MTSSQRINSILNISFLNVCGLRSKLTLPDFDEFLSACNILGVAETKTCEDGVIPFPNYTYFPKHRLGMWARNFCKKQFPTIS